MAQERDECCHVVEFTLHNEKDEDGGAELLVRAKGNWIYTSISPDGLTSSKGKTSTSLLKEYQNLRDAAVKTQEEKEAELMGQVHDDAERAEESHASKKRKTSHSDDSGYVSESGREPAEHEPGQSHRERNRCQNEDPEQALQNWMLAPLASHFDRLADQTTADDSTATTLSNWYNCPVHFFHLVASSEDPGQLEATERTDLDPKRFRSHTLEHTLNLPKDLRDAAPWYSPDDIQVISEEDDIHMPIHPTLVRLAPQSSSREPPKPSSKKGQASHFLKLVPTGQGARHSVIREISHLQRIQNLTESKPKLKKSLRFPRLCGLIAPPSTKGSHASILGFLLELIPSPTPLTHKFSTDIPSEKRERWAAEADAMVKALHSNGVTWGDAKADNFLVEGTEEEKLWMIDFGGGFTEGWVLAEQCETQQGDKEGIEKIVRGLEDPEGATYGSSDEEIINEEDNAGKSNKEKGESKKRKR